MISSTIYERLADVVDVHGWRDGVAIVLNELSSDDKEALFWEINLGAQAAWMLWVGRTSQDHVLNLDDGIGTTTVALSFLFPKVTGVFHDESSRRCAIARARQDGRNIDTVSIHQVKDSLSFQEGQFDLICFSNLYAWVEGHGTSLLKGKEFLFKLLDLLTPRGMIYLGGRENPFFQKLWLGSQGLSHHWLLSLLEEKLFRVVTKLNIYPSYGPIETVTEERGLITYGQRYRATLRKIVKGESSGLLLGKSWPFNTSGVIRNIEQHHETVHTDRSDIRVYVGTANTLVGKLPGGIVRVPLGREPLSRCRNNFETLHALRAISPVAIPVPCHSGQFGDLVYFEETKLPGDEPIGQWKWDGKSDMITAQAFRYLLQLHAITSQKVILGEGLYESLVGLPFKSLYGYCQRTDKDLFANVEILLKERLLGKEAVLVRTHGDFKRTNLLVNETGKVIGLIDWDLSRTMGFPFIDLLWYLSYEIHLKRRIPFYQAIVRVAFEDDLFLNERVQSYWQELGIGPPERQKIYAAILLLYQIHEHLDHWHKAEQDWFSHTMVPILRFAFENALGAAVEHSRSAL